MTVTPRGTRRTDSWASAQKPRQVPRVVRVGRPANDNARRPNLRVRLAIAMGLVIALSALALISAGV